MSDFKSKYTNLLKESAEILEKTASYVSEIETKLSNSNMKASSLEKEAKENTRITEISEPMEKLANAGFTEKELQDLEGADKSTLEKLAHLSEQPVGLGYAHGASADDAGDPLTRFLMS